MRGGTQLAPRHRYCGKSLLKPFQISVWDYLTFHVQLRPNFVSEGGGGGRVDCQDGDYGGLLAPGWLSGLMFGLGTLKPSGWFPWSGQEAGVQRDGALQGENLLPDDFLWMLGGGVTRTPCFLWGQFWMDSLRTGQSAMQSRARLYNVRELEMEYLIIRWRAIVKAGDVICLLEL